MKLTRYQFVEIVGIAGVMASLLFVGMQLMLDRKLAIATQYAARAESIKSDLRAEIESDVYLSARAVLWENRGKPSWWTEEFEQTNREYGLSSAENVALIISTNIAILQLDNLYFQYKQGFLTEEFWMGARENVKNSIRNPITRAIYMNRSPRLPISDVLDELVLELEAN